MAEEWSKWGGSQTEAVPHVTLMEGTTFCISDSTGDLTGVEPGGLFVRDTRMLLTWDLAVGGRRCVPLTVDQETPYDGVCVGHVHLDDPATEVLVARHRVVGNGMREEITLTNCSSRPCQVVLTLQVAADLADLFEVKDGRATGKPRPAVVEPPNHLHVASNNGYGVVVVPDASAVAHPDGFAWTVALGRHGTWSTTLEVVPRVAGEMLTLHHPRHLPVTEALPHQRRREWWDGVPGLSTANRTLREVLRASVEDLGMLRIFDPEHLDQPVVAAGAPWFMALFGRDSLITSMMVMPIESELALATCLTLARHQGVSDDDLTEEQPGKILHELRLGPAGTLALGGGSVYYGSVDATALFVMTLGKLLQWRGPDSLTPELLESADRALGWILEHGDRDRDGFVEYSRRTVGGLRNQGWKDSEDGVNFADGRLAEPPIALAEVQGYSYAAFLARAELADALEDGRGADEWRARAEELRQRFEERFWLPDRGWYAVGLDGDKEPIDALTSNIGHLLWTGIVSEERAASVAAHLLSPEMFSGWGIRTLASSMDCYDPMSYHNGSVWPHDTAICVAGLARYGYVDEAVRVATGLLDAARHFGYRLPELFSGFARGTPPMPVPYPAACLPQAWAAASPVELVRVLLGLEPAGEELSCAPAAPPAFAPLELSGLRYRGRSWTVEVADDGTHAVRAES